MIGRTDEIHALDGGRQREETQFVAVHGRWRTGRMFLALKVFRKQFALCNTGMRDGNLDEQLQALQLSPMRCGCHKCPQPRNCPDVYSRLYELIAQEGKADREVVFPGELLRMGSLRSGIGHTVVTLGDWSGE